MATSHNLQWTHAEASAYLGGKESRPAPHGTHTTVEQVLLGDVVLKHHATDIIRWRPDGTAVLDTNGWRTATTKHRLNNYTAAVVFQKDFEWFIQPKNVDGSTNWEAQPVPFFDGITIDARTGAPIISQTVRA